MARKSNWRGYGRLSGSDAARQAVPVWVCSRPGCEVHHRGVKDSETGKFVGPAQCLGCGGMAFDYFQSTGEANRWAALRLQENIGVISGLRRQVRVPLMTIGPNGLQAWVADAVLDYAYVNGDGEQVWEDHKPANGMDPVANLKFRWIEAQYGRGVQIYAS